MNWDEVKVLTTETKTFPRKIRESIEIRKLKPDINDNQEYNLSPLYAPLLDSPR